MAISTCEFYIVDTDNYFDAAQGLYWYCVENYSGMGDPLYRIQCALGYTPGCMEHGPDMGGMLFYTALSTGELDPEDLADDIDAAYNAAH